MNVKFYKDSTFTYLKITNSEYKGNYIYIPRASTFLKIKYLEFENFTYEIQDFKITKNDNIFNILIEKLEKYENFTYNDDLLPGCDGGLWEFWK